MTVVTETGNKLNIYPKEPTMYPVDHNYRPFIAWDFSGEKLNGRAAMFGVVAGAISYALTGKLFFGLF